jgi:hypothetical protein
MFVPATYRASPNLPSNWSPPRPRFSQFSSACWRNVAIAKNAPLVGQFAPLFRSPNLCHNPWFHNDFGQSAVHSIAASGAGVIQACLRI